MIRVLIGIDDTDNKESRGTGYRSRQLGKLIEGQKRGIVDGITRHQLLFDPRIPYTSQNSSACLDVRTPDISEIIRLSRAYLLKESAKGSDVGLAVLAYEYIDEEIIAWGFRAKNEILTQQQANELATKKQVYLEGLTGDLGGIIGSLAALGLRKSGEDGRFIWLSGLEIRDLKGVYKIETLLEKLHVDLIVDKQGNKLPKEDRIDVGEWVRPAIKKNKITVIADKILNNSDYEWKVSSKEYLKSISD
ncbi:MAG: hypothetical protein JW729_03875 [Bacteroidales bacterium]|nr:hypothetical protein [Bacteroidales bacterium]